MRREAERLQKLERQRLKRKAQADRIGAYNAAKALEREQRAKRNLAARSIQVTGPNTRFALSAGRARTQLCRPRAHWRAPNLCATPRAKRLRVALARGVAAHDAACCPPTSDRSPPASPACCLLHPPAATRAPTPGANPGQLDEGDHARADHVAAGLAAAGCCGEAPAGDGAGAAHASGLPEAEADAALRGDAHPEQGAGARGAAGPREGGRGRSVDPGDHSGTPSAAHTVRYAQLWRSQSRRWPPREST